MKKSRMPSPLSSSGFITVDAIALDWIILCAFIGNIAPAKQLHGGVKFVDELPRTGTGKIDRKAIKQQFIKDVSESSFT